MNTDYPMARLAAPLSDSQFALTRNGDALGSRAKAREFSHPCSWMAGTWPAMTVLSYGQVFFGVYQMGEAHARS